MLCYARAQVTLEEAQAHGPSHMLPATYANPLGRASITRPTPAMFERASVVCLHPQPKSLPSSSAARVLSACVLMRCIQAREVRNTMHAFDLCSSSAGLLQLFFALPLRVLALRGVAAP